MLVAFLLLAAYGTGGVGTMVGRLCDSASQGLNPVDPVFKFFDGVRNGVDFEVFVILAILSYLAVKAGAQPMAVVTVGSIVGFTVLTIDQTPLIRYLSLAAALFAIGLYGMVVSRNAVRVLISIELMLNAVNLNMVAFARYVDPVALRGQLFAIFILTVAAAEAAVGLAIVLAIYRNRSTVDMEKFNLLKW
jgi:NAD(P)H-quinone oxidoreductase subunit 4L